MAKANYNPGSASRCRAIPLCGGKEFRKSLQTFHSSSCYNGGWYWYSILSNTIIFLVYILDELLFPSCFCIFLDFNRPDLYTKRNFFLNNMLNLMDQTLELLLKSMTYQYYKNWKEWYMYMLLYRKGQQMQKTFCIYWYTCYLCWARHKSCDFHVKCWNLDFLWRWIHIKFTPFEMNFTWISRLAILIVYCNGISKQGHRKKYVF